MEGGGIHSRPGLRTWLRGGWHAWWLGDCSCHDFFPLPPAITVVLADDHVVMAEALQSLLCSRCEIVGVVSDGHALVAKAIEVVPDLIVLDIGMPVLPSPPRSAWVRSDMFLRNRRLLN